MNSASCKILFRPGCMICLFIVDVFLVLTWVFCSIKVLLKGRV